MNAAEKPIRVYLAHFNGRKLGAIGLSQWFRNIEVKGEDENAARLNLYQTHDHIMALTLVEVTHAS